MNASDPLKVIQIFEYLRAVKNLNESIFRDISDYEMVWWEENILSVEGCYLGGNGTKEDAWLEVHKQEIMPVPALPKILSGWVSKWDDPEVDPSLTNKRIKGINEETKEEIFEHFDENEERVHTYQSWLKDTWKKWAVDSAPKFKIQSIYNELFALYQRLQREGDDLEINWGHGLLSWKIENEKVQRHVFVTRLELQFDAKKGIFSLSPTSKGTQFETDMLINLDIPNAARLQEMEHQLNEMEFSLWDLKSIESLYSEVVHTISSKGMYVYKQKQRISSLSSDPVIQHSPAIFLRKSSGRIWDKELSNAIQKIKEGLPIPETLINLTTHERTIDSSESLATNQSEWASVGEELLFPLPANKEQKLIAQKLAINEGVVVQGPPGTGKSHTIANLICHLLAHGKRVLITSEKERALQVLRDKIPEDVRALCVSVLGGDSRSVKEIEDSIKMIAENLDSKQPEVLENNINRLKIELDQTRRNIAKHKSLMNQSAEVENVNVSISGTTFTPLEGSKWLKKHEQYKLIPDLISYESEFPFTPEETLEFFKLLGELKTEDQVSLETHRPRVTKLSSPALFEENVNQINEIESLIRNKEAYIEGWQVSKEYSFDINKQLEFVRNAIEKFSAIQDQKWLIHILKEVLGNNERKQFWQDFVIEVNERTTFIEKVAAELIEDEIEIPRDKNLTLLVEDLTEIKQRLENNKNLSWFFKQVVGRKFSYIFEQVKVNDLPIRHLADVEKVIKFIEKTETSRKLVLKWNRMLEDIEGPLLDENQKRLTNSFQSHIKLLSTIPEWYEKVITPLTPILKEIRIENEALWDDLKWYISLQNGLEVLDLIQKREKANEFFSNTISFLQEQHLKSSLHSLNDVLLKACKDKDVITWRNAYNELSRLEGLEQSFAILKNHTEKLSNVAPEWTNHLLTKGGKGVPLTPPADLEKYWYWSQVNSWINEVHSRPKVEELELELHREQKKEAKLIQELVAEQTWKSQIDRTTREQKRSLFAWLKAVQRIGKGTGKYANVYRQEASKEMKTARGAIPVWIMPINRVIENIELTNDLFDVVIIDESSQSTLFSLSALLRAKKAVIVGDDNQISPESVGTDISEVHDLIERYLYNIPNKLQFEMKTSLYDTASRIFDSKIILKEHFRCVPEIIQFSNDFMYGGMIDPLRLPLGNEVLEPPVKAIRVLDGYRREDTRKTINEPEAESIVNHISELCQNPKYQNKTMGVISLQGHDQAKLIENLLREKLGEEEMIERKIICGDSYSFQGDERDVIFLSMVIAPNVRFTSMSTRPAQQRYNVAASRARDQMILFHSVDLNELNPEDVRYKLLQYCKEPYRVQLEVDEVKADFDSKFEEDVFRMIVARGYKVIPQVKVGSVGKRIDLVVEGMRNRLAVECDGDAWHGLDKWEEDMERQRVLERVGWTFWRVRGSQFYLDREKAMSSLWEKLKKMGIEPVSKVNV